MDSLRGFLKNFRPGGNTTYVAIVPDGPTTARTFNGADPETIDTWTERQNRSKNVYFTVNGTAAGLARKPTKEDLTEIEAVWADVDPRDGKGGPSWADERERLLALADELHGRPIPPTFVVDSGNGVQPVWTLDDPIEATPENREAAESLCRQIEHALGASGTYNCDRLLRVPGTTNYPNARKRRLGRGETAARLLRWTWKAYSWSDLERLAADLERNPPRHAIPILARRARLRSTASGGVPELHAIPKVTKGLRKRFRAALARDSKLHARWDGAPPRGPAGDETASAFDLSLAHYMRAHDFSVEEFAAIAAKWEHGKGTDGDARHFARCYAAAAESIEGDDLLSHDQLALDLAEDWQAGTRYLAAVGRWLEWDEASWKRDEVLRHMSSARRWLRARARKILEEGE